MNLKIKKCLDIFTLIRDCHSNQSHHKDRCLVIDNGSYAYNTNDTLRNNGKFVLIVIKTYHPK